MAQVPLLSAQKGSGYWAMNTPDQFEQAVDAYQGPVANRPQEVLYSSYFFVFFETAKLFPNRRDEIDGLDWSKIYLRAQPDPAL